MPNSLKTIVLLGSLSAIPIATGGDALRQLLDEAVTVRFRER